MRLPGPSLLLTALLLSAAVFAQDDFKKDIAETAWPERAGKTRCISPDATYDENPAIALDADGQPWVAWVGWTDKQGDNVYLAHQTADGWSGPQTLTQQPGNYARPVVAVADDVVHVVWTQASPDGTSIWMVSGSADGFDPPTRVSPQRGKHQEPALAVDALGKLWMAWQAMTGESFDILLSRYDGTAWSDPITVADQPGNEWNPAVACDSAGGVWVAFSRFADADYDIFLNRLTDNQLGDEIRLSDHDAYDMHASLAVDGQDRVWIAWDRMRITGHSMSGDSRIDGLSPRTDQHISTLGHTDGTIEVRCVDGGKVLAPAQALPPPPGPKTPQGHNKQMGSYHLSYSAYPQVAVDAGGSIWLTYRAYMRPHWSSGYGEWWDVFAQRYAGNEWNAPVILKFSDGYIDAPALAAGVGGVWAAYHKEYTRPSLRDRERTIQQTLADGKKPHYGIPGRLGDLYAAQLEARPAKAVELIEAKPLSEAPSPLAEVMIPAEARRYTVKDNGQTYHLYWGDLHKHTTVLCVFNPEPESDTWFQYSRDIYQHDFSAVTDHQHNDGCMSDYQWWTMQKVADLYNAPGQYVTFYGSEVKQDAPYSKTGGHRNYIYYERPVPNHAPRHNPPSFRGIPGKTIEIPHVPFTFDNDIRPFDETTVRLVEVFQAMRAASEVKGGPREFENHKKKKGFGDHVHDGLAKGYRFGLIASSDHGFGGAYAAVYATSKSRKDIFDALHARRCYGTTAYGIVLDVRAGEHWMGEAFEAADPAKLKIHVRGYDSIVMVDLFRDQKIVRTWGDTKHAQTIQKINPGVAKVWKDLGKGDLKNVELEWAEPDPAAGAHNYYVRVILEDGEMAWSSPIYVTYK